MKRSRRNNPFSGFREGSTTSEGMGSSSTHYNQPQARIFIKQALTLNLSTTFPKFMTKIYHKNSALLCAYLRAPLR